jgi:hypothetical protein
MKKPKNLETLATKVAKDVLEAKDNDWIKAARELKAQARNKSELLNEIVGPLISDRIWQTIERITPITMGGGSLLNCPLSATEHRLLGDAGKVDLENEIAFFNLSASKCIENIDWLHAVAGELGEGQTVREKFTADSILEFREKFDREWKGELQIEGKEKTNPIKKLAVEALYVNKGEWFLALQSLTQRVSTDSQALYHLTGPVFYTMVWHIFSRVAEKTIDMKPPLNYTLSSGWIFGDSTVADLNDEIALWEDSGRYYLRKIKWLELMKEAVGDEGKVEGSLGATKVKKLWNEAYQAIS